MDDTQPLGLPEEYSILFSDDGLDLFENQSFEFDSPEISTGDFLASDALDDYASQVFSWNINGNAAWNTESNVSHPESSSDEDFVVLSPQPTPPYRRATSRVRFDSEESVANSAANIEYRDQSAEPPTSNKRIWESSVVIFSSNLDNKYKAKHPKRKVFDETQRREVALTRIY